MISIAVLLLSASLAQSPGVISSLTPRESVSLKTLRQKSDLILVGTIQSITADSRTGVVQLSVVRVLHGTLDSRDVDARFMPPFWDAMPARGVFPGSWVGATGVWFLQASDSAFQVMPLTPGVYWANNAFIPVGADTPDPPAGNIDQQLLWYVTERYLALPHPDKLEDARILAHIFSADKTDGRAAAGRLIDSGSPDQVAIGISAAIQFQPEDALAALASHVELIQGSSKVWRITLGIVALDRSHSETELPAIQSIASKHLAIPDLDSALAGRLVQIGGRNVLPVMALLTDSRDAGIKRRAAIYIAHFAGGPPGTSTESILFWVSTQSVSP